MVAVGHCGRTMLRGERIPQNFPCRSLTRRTPSDLIQAIHVPGASENGSAKPFPGTVTKAGSLLGGKMTSLL